MKSQDTKKSSLELKQEVHSELNKVKKGLDDIQGRMTPGQFIDDIIFYPHGGSPRRTLEYLKNNPIGTSLLSMGTILLMEDKNKLSVEKRAKEKVESGAKSIRESTHDPRIGETKEKLRELGINAKSKVNSFRTELAAKIPNKEKIEQIDGRSMIVLGAGLGVMTGASLPISDKENKLFEDSELNQKFSEFDQDFRDALNQCTNVLKDLVVKDVKGFDINIF